MSVAVVLGGFVSLVVLELGLRAAMPQLASAQPAHDVLFITPDRVAGWKHPTNFEFFWNGRNPYCIEFGVNVTTNNFGFRDRPWTVDAPDDTIRIAVVGDSFIEAIQVPLEHTAVRQLETQLARRFPDERIETMNFGVSNYGVGQYLMVYDEYVRPFRPDYVVLFASYLNFTRTTQRELSSRLQEFYALRVRPSYELDQSGNLVHVPAQDYEQYVASVQALVDTRYGEDRTTPIHPVRSPFYLTHWLLNVASRIVTPSERVQRRTNADFPDVQLNYRIIKELHQRVQSDQGMLVFADAFEYLERYGVTPGSGALAARNRAFVESLGARYVDVSPAFRTAPSNPQFECDMHFSQTGNRVLADALFDWFATELQ